MSTIEKILSKDDLEIKYIDTKPFNYVHINKNKDMIDILNKYGR